MKKLSSGVLYYVVFVMLISWIICVSILLLVKLNNIVFNNTLLENKLSDDLLSAQHIVCANPDLFSATDSIHFSLENEGKSEVYVKKKYWGLLNVLNFNVERRMKHMESIVLVGNNLNYQEPIALYMIDENKYLSVSGNTYLNGNCYLPKLGIKRGYIEGNTYKAKTLVYGQIKVSKTKLPDVDQKAMKILLSFLRNFKPDTFSEIYTIKEFHASNKHFVSFKNRTIAYCAEKPLIIANKSLKGNILICSSKLVKISKSNTINDIIVLAPKIIVEEGFKGNLQLYATDSLIIERRCQLGYPSVLALISENINNIYLKIAEKCRIDGVIILNQYNQASSKPVLSIDKDSEFFGQVYCNGTVSSKGNFTGSVYCRNFMLNTRTAIYENHLLNTRIDRKNLSPYFCGIAIADSLKMKFGIIKELE